MFQQSPMQEEETKQRIFQKKLKVQMTLFFLHVIILLEI